MGDTVDMGDRVDTVNKFDNVGISASASRNIVSMLRDMGVPFDVMFPFFVPHFALELLH